MPWRWLLQGPFPISPGPGRPPGAGRGPPPAGAGDCRRRPGHPARPGRNGAGLVARLEADMTLGAGSRRHALDDDLTPRTAAGDHPALQLRRRWGVRRTVQPLAPLPAPWAVWPTRPTSPPDAAAALWEENESSGPDAVEHFCRPLTAAPASGGTGSSTPSSRLRPAPCKARPSATGCARTPRPPLPGRHGRSRRRPTFYIMAPDLPNLRRASLGRCRRDLDTAQGLAAGRCADLLRSQNLGAESAALGRPGVGAGAAQRQPGTRRGAGTAD